jgi:CheY-like chemotaxis protein
VVVDAENGAEGKTLPRNQEVGYVVLTRGRCRDQPKDGGGSIQVLNRHTLRLASFVKAVATAAGMTPVKREDSALDKPTAPCHASPEDRWRARPKRLVLVVEDNKTNQKVISKQLQLLGYAADIAENGRDALALWRDKRYGLVLTDCHMPEMDGFELTAAIRREEPRQDAGTSIVAVSANAMANEAERCRKAGMDDYLAKPIQLDTLRTLLDKWLPDSP